MDFQSITEDIVRIYFVCCFHQSLKDNILKLSLNNEEIDKEFEKTLPNNKDYIYLIYCLKYKKDSKIPKKLDLTLILKNIEKNIQISIKIEKARFILESIDIKNTKDLIQLFDLDQKIPSITTKNYYEPLNIDKQFDIFYDYLDYLRNENKDNKINLNEYSKYLIKDYITIIKSKKYIEQTRPLTSLIKLFTLSYNNDKEIITFLDSFEDLKINLQVDKMEQIDNKFIQLLTNYKNDNNKFFSPLYKISDSEENLKKKTKFNEKYKQKINKFIYIYYILYDDIKMIKVNANNINEYEEILKSLLKKITSINECFTFIIDKFDLFEKIYEFKKLPSNIRYTFKIENKFDIDIYRVESFKDKYKELIDLQKTIFIDFSITIEKWLNISKKNLDLLIKLFTLFKRELNSPGYIKLLTKYRDSIHNLAIEQYRKGQLENKKIIDYLPYDDYYTTSIDLKKKQKDIFILEGINIQSKDDPLIKDIENKEIYKYFDKIPDVYLSIFLKKLNKIKDLSCFFRILPDNYFNMKSCVLLINWIKENINTFSIKICTTFEDEINRFCTIMCKHSKESLIDLIDFFSNRLGNSCNQLFIYILNYNINLNLTIEEKLINYYTKNGNNKLESILYFIEHLEKKEDNILKIFFEKINDLSLKNIDIYSKKESNNLKLFKKLLSHKNDFINNRKGNYLENTNKNCKDILSEIKELNIIFNDINKKENIFLEKSFVERIKLLFLFTENDINNKFDTESNNLYSNLINNYRIWEKNIDDLKVVEEYYNVFFNKDEMKIKEKDKVKSFIKKLKKAKLNELLLDNNNLNKDYKKYKEQIYEADDRLKLYKNSLLFKEIYESKEKEIKNNQSKLLTDSYKSFIAAIKILDEKPEKIHNNDYIKFFFDVGYKNETDLDKEINWLIEYLNKKMNEDVKEKLLKSLKILIKKKSLDNIIEGILSFIDLYDNNIKSNEEDKKFINKLKESSNSLKKKISAENVNQIMNYLKGIFVHITFDDNDLNYKDKILGLFVEFNKNKESFNCIKDLKFSQVENINQFLSDIDENEVTLNDLEEFIKVIRFLNNILESSKNKIDLINNLINGTIDEKKCGNCLMKTLKKINKIRNFLDIISKGEEGCFTKIQRIMEKSHFYINYNKNEDKIELIGFYEKNNNINLKDIFNLEDINDINKNKYSTIDQKELDELYQKAFISKNQKNISDSIYQYIQLYKDMTKIKNILNKLYNSYGYSLLNGIKVDVIEKKVNCELDKKNYKLEDLKNYFYEEKKKCQDFYELSLKNNKEIIFFYGRQLFLIYSCLKNKNYNEIKELLCSISNGLINKFDDNNFNLLLPDNYDNMIKNIQLYIKHQLNKNRKNIDNIYQKNIIMDPFKNQLNKGFYFYLKGNDLELFVLTIFFNITGKYPSSNNLLLCNNDTTFEEIQSIINRAIYCDNNNLFIIAKCELLNAYQKRKLIYELKKKTSVNTNIKNVLIIVFSHQDSDFHKLIMKIKRINTIDFDKLQKKQNYMDNKNENIEIVTSRYCGLGKSTYAQKINNNSSIIYFPLGGDLNRRDLIERIKNEIPHTYNNQNYIFHIVLGQTKDLEILKEFIFKLLIFRKCDYNNNVRYFGSNVNIIIEIPNDYMNYFRYIKFLLLYKKKDILDLANINLSKEAKVVTTFLLRYENGELLNQNILNIDIECNPSQNICQQLILKYIGINNPNFYQINTFIKILAKEFEFFNNCFGLTPKSLYSTGMPLNLRNTIINSLIKVTKHFTIGPYEDLIKSQQKTKEILDSKKEDKELIINGALYLNISSITYDDIKPSLVAFNNDANSITIITTCNEEQEEYKDLQKLFNSQCLEYQKKYGYQILKKYNLNKKFDKNNNFDFLDDLENMAFLINSKDKNNGKKKGIENIKDLKISNKDRNNLIELDDIKLNESINLIDNKNDGIPKLKNVKNLEPNEILNKLLSFLNVNGLSDNEIKNIVGNYIYTPDNFIKVILILMRLRAKVPVVMMGETGCGKTALIKMAYKLISKCQSNMKIFNIHAGTDDKDLIKFIDEVKKEVKNEDSLLLDAKIFAYNELPEKDRKEYEKTTTKEQQFEGYRREINQRKIWIFFDEINTCNSMGLLSEILCQNTIRGKPIDERYVFIAACNPYRLLSKESKIDNVLYHKKAKKKKLVYSVNPLPHSLLNFVFNFGSLKDEDEKKYIESMIKEPTESLFQNDIINSKDECKKLIKLQIDVISLCQNFMKDNNDVSIVSLREVNRYIIFFKFFIEFIKKRNTNENNSKDEEEIISYYRNKTRYDIYICGVNLAIYICYYLRLPDKIIRTQFENIINKKYFNGDFLKLPNLELNYLINNLVIPIGIAKNQALKENIFASMFCIVNKIPLIICGKPGRGKTLSIQILQNSMKGKEGSKSYICQIFPELIIHKIQGALNTTSEEILSVFKKGREFQEKNKEKIILVLMDEMGLAEISDNNPLKVTHYELEKEENKVSFVGISNWALDASKMNRVVYIIGQEPDEDDLIITAKEIVKSYELNGKNKINYYEKYQIVFDNLSKAYYKYIEDKKKQNNDNAFFHGSRDFYSLIKTTIKDIIENINLIEGYIFNRNKKMDKLNEICLKNIERNFGGLEDSLNEFKAIFYELFNGQKETIFNNSYDIMTCLKENLYDNSSRYLLLISDSIVSKDVLFYMLEEINVEVRISEDKNKIIENENIINIKDEEEEEEIDTIGINNLNKKKKNVDKKHKEIKYYLGSKFKEDKDKNFYSDDMLNKIKYQMEKNNILVLKDLEIVYPSLYELFNRNFVELNEKKFTYLGKSQTKTLVNDNFKVIVYVDKENVPKEDPPFLNRFEKHILSINNILENNLIELANEIYSVLKEIISFNLNNNKKDVVLNRNLKFVDIDEVRGLVFIANKKKIKKKEEIIEFILNKIVPTFTEDMIIYIEKFDFKRNYYNRYYENIIQIYKKNYRYNLYDYLEKTKNRMVIMYTFSSISDKIFENNQKINNTYFNQDFKIDSLKEIIISEINSINYLDKLIVDYISEIYKNLCIIKLRVEDLNKLDNIINLVEDYIQNEKNYILINKGQNIRKIFIILIHLSRTKVNKLEINVNKECISYLSNIPQIFIDNINNKFTNFTKIIEKSNEDIIFNIINYIELSNKFENYFRNFSYNIIGGKDNNDLDIQNYRSLIIEKIKNDNNLTDIIKTSIKAFSKKENDYLSSIFNDKKINNEDYDFMDSLSIYLSTNVEDYSKKLIYLYDQNQIFTCFLSNPYLFKSELLKRYLKNFSDNINNENLSKIKLDGVDIKNKKEQNILLGIKVPFIQNIIYDIFNYIENKVTKKYIQNDTYIMRSKIANENIENEKKKYKNNMRQLQFILENEVNNYKFINDILTSNDINLIKNFFNDCFIVFLSKNNNFKTNYDILIQLLEVIIQIRLNPITNNKEILLKDSFIDCLNALVKEEKNEKNLDDSYENLNKINEEENINIINEINNNNYTNIFSTILNFIQSYSKDIYNILELYNLIYKKDIKSIKNSIIKDISMDDKRNPDYSKDIKCCFYYIIESLLMYIRRNKRNEPYNYYKNYQCYFENIIKLEKKFLLFSKEIFTLELINKIIYSFDKQINKNINLEEINKLIKLMMDEVDIDNENIDDINNKLYKNLEDTNELLKKLYQDSYEYGELLNDIILNKYKIIKLDQFRQKIIENILLKENKKNNLYLFIRLIIDDGTKYETPKCMYNTINMIEYKQKFIEKNKELFLFYFEYLIENYFVKIKNEQNNDKEKYDNLFGNDSLKYLGKAINILEKKKENIIKILYSLAYIKRYVINFVNLVFSDNIQMLGHIKEINYNLYEKKIKAINEEIKLFTLKLILHKNNYDLGSLVNLNDDISSNYLDYDSNFKGIFKNKKSIILYYFSYPVLDDIKINMLVFLSNNNNSNNLNNNNSFNCDDYKSFLSLINNEEIIEEEKITELFNRLSNNNNKYDILYTYLSYILYKTFIYNLELNPILDNFNRIFTYFSSKESSNFKASFIYYLNGRNNDKWKKILSKIGCNIKDNKVKFNKLEILLYAFRFFFNIITTNKVNNFYYSLATNFNETIKKNYIPGILINNDIINSYEKIKGNLTKNPKSIEYLCCCGLSHSLSDHNQTINCQECKLLKNKKYALFGKNFFGRIFLNDMERKSFYSKYAKNESNMLLNELEKKINEDIQFETGIKKVSKKIFSQKSIDNISYISFRLLNFILYGIMFYSNIEDIIKDEELSNNLVESMECFEIIEMDWELLDKELKIKEIPNVHIFMDSIFHQVIKEINKPKTFKSKKELKNFEKSIETIIKNELDKNNIIKNYINNRSKYIDIEPDKELAIIMEEEVYNDNWKTVKNDYPEIEHFIICKLPSFEDFKNEFNYVTENKDYYPIINFILNDISIIEKLNYLPKINELCNYMIDYCSYKFTRDEANKKRIFDEIKDKEDLINEFIDIFEELRPFVTHYECHIFSNNKMLNSLRNERDLYLSNFCVDIGEFNYGMVLASIYKKLIYWHNSFINQILYSKNNSHNKYKDLFKNEIMIQDCNENDLIKIIYPEDLMKNYIIQYSNKKKYGIIDYNYRLIEEELAKDILPNIKKFVSDNDKCLKYVIYQYEGFRGNKDNIITIFNEKYERKELTKDEITDITDFIQGYEKKEAKNIIDCWFSLQILIDVILENNYNGEELVSTVVNENNKNKNFENLKKLFEKNKKFKVNSVMSIFYYFELICWDNIKENLVDEYLEDINQNIKDKIDKFFDPKNKRIIAKKNLSTAIRRFVSRYLSGKRGQNEINEKNNFIYYLCNKELWDQKDIVDNPEFDIELGLLFDTDNSPNMISVGKVTKLHEYLGDEMQLYINDEKENKESKKNSLFSNIRIIIGSYWNKKEKIQEENEERNDDENEVSRKGSRKSELSSISNDSDKSNRNSYSSNDSQDEEIIRKSNSNHSLDNDDYSNISYT